MKKETLKECLESIRRVQASKHNELNASVIKELSETAERLEFLLEMETDNVVPDQPTVKKALTVIGRTAVALGWVRKISQTFLE